MLDIVIILNGRKCQYETKDETVATWDCVYFGSYNDYGLVWRVLDVDEDGIATMVADECLKYYDEEEGEWKTETRVFDEDNSKVWETSDIKTWLNGEFKEALGEAEQSDIEGDIKLLSWYNTMNIDYGFVSDSARATGDDYWTLTANSDTQHSDLVIVVHSDGTVNQIDSSGTEACLERGVRPVIKINLNTSTNYTYAGKVSSDGSVRDVIEVPSVNTGLVYNKKTQQAIDDTEGYVVSGNTAKNAGKYTVTVTPDDSHIWADGTLDAKEMTWSIAKATQTVKITTSTKTVKYKKVKKKARYTSKVAVSGAQGTKTFTKVSGSKKLTITKAGKIKVKKKTKKGTYKIKVKVTSAATTNYNAKSVTKTIKVKVK